MTRSHRQVSFPAILAVSALGFWRASWAPRTGLVPGGLVASWFPSPALNPPTDPPRTMVLPLADLKAGLANFPRKKE